MNFSPSWDELDQDSLRQDLDLVDRELAERSLKDYIHQAWHIVEPSTPLHWTWADDAVVEHLEAVTCGQIENLLINVGPGTGKSTKVAVMWPTWEWRRDPTTRWLFGSHSNDFVIRDSVRRRFIMESAWYRKRWADRFSFLTDQNVKTEFMNDHMGVMRTFSITGGVTGRRANRIVIDDPINIQDLSVGEKALDEAAHCFNQSIPGRKDDGCRMVTVMQRAHVKDPSGLLLERGNVVHLKIPMESDGKPCRTSIGWEDPRKEAGICMDPDRYPPKRLADLKIELGSDGYAGQYLQRPVAPGGAMVKSAWLQKRWVPGSTPFSYRLGDTEWKLDELMRFIIVDLAVSLKKMADFTVIGALGMTPRTPCDLILLDVDRRRIEGPDIIPAIKTMKDRLVIPQVWIEKAGFQLSLIQDARRQGLPVMELIADKDKAARMMAAVPLMEAGRFWLPKQAPWLEACVHELVSFPKGDHDDFPDMVAYAARVCQSMFTPSVTFF